MYALKSHHICIWFQYVSYYIEYAQIRLKFRLCSLLIHMFKRNRQNFQRKTRMRNRCSKNRRRRRIRGGHHSHVKLIEGENTTIAFQMENKSFFFFFFWSGINEVSILIPLGKLLRIQLKSVWHVDMIFVLSSHWIAVGIFCFSSSFFYWYSYHINVRLSKLLRLPVCQWFNVRIYS